MNDLWQMRVIVGCVVLISLSYVLVRHIARKRRLPPGPSGWPIVGNALQIPATRTWLTLSKWAKQYGEIMYLNVLGQPYVVLSSAKIARELLDKRSSIYSDRPRMVMASELAGYDRSMVLAPYGDRWRKQRRLVAQEFSPSSVPRYYDIQEREARKLVRCILDDPNSIEEQTKLRIGAIIIRVTYGYDVQSFDDIFLTMSLRNMDNFSKATAPGAWPVDILPLLKYIPEWVPGCSSRKTGKEWRELYWDVSWSMHLYSQKGDEKGPPLLPNLCATVQSQKGGKSDLEEEHLVWAANTIMGGGLDTNMSTVLSFFLAMILHPDVQKRARAEIDSVIGHDKLPSIADKPSLPYVRSLITEVMRWNPAVPLGIPHSPNQADVYEDFYIPRGALIVPNVWHMLRDPEVFPNPDEFDPDRYKNSDAEMQKVKDLAFGFGRRACPGIHFAEGTVFAIIATVLATCEILPALDSNGRPIAPSVAYTSGSIVFPEPFKCMIKCRSARASQLLFEDSGVHE